MYGAQNMVCAQGMDPTYCTAPYQVDHPEVYRQRSGEAVLPRTQDWWDAYTQLRERFNSEPELKVAVATTV